ncbi:MAG: ABC transporter permease [Candidimonas sp.]|jgi:ABC-type nitrate/sulfonate/bicarbonate transport system permease component
MNAVPDVASASSRLHLDKVLRHRWIPVLIVFLAWEIVPGSGWISSRFFPPFHNVAIAFWKMAADGELGPNLGATLTIAFLGLFIATIAGVMLGAGMAVNRWLDRMFGPLVAATYSLPKSALIPLFILWFGIGGMSNLLTVVLGCLLPILVSAYHGVSQVPKELIWSARAMGTGPRRLLVNILLPAATASIFNGVRIGLGYCFVLVISAEMIATKIGMGKLIFLYGEGGTYDYMMAGILAVVLVAFIADQLLMALSRRLLYWEDTASRGSAYA